MNTELNKISRVLVECQRLVQRAEMHIKEGLSAEGANDLRMMFRRLAPVPPRAYKLADSLETMMDIAIASNLQPCNLEITNPQCSFPSPYIFLCQLDTPPFLRDQKNGREYSQLAGLEISRATAATLQSRHHRFKEVDVIFVNQTSAACEGKQPYYDNDNLLIKSMLDAIISLVAFDDAAQYCTNIYTIEYCESPGFAIYVVERGHLFEWAQMYPESVFAKEVGQITEKLRGK